MAISKDNEAALADCSREGIATRFEGLTNEWANSRWLPATNRYCADTAKTIKADLKSSSLKETDAADYVAASAVPHCLDGWAYFGHALAALMSGDANASRHLAYYAELRAAMSVLAGEGVGVFNDQHIAVHDSTSNPICKPFPTEAGTHAFVWEAFDAWAQLERASDLLMRVVRIGPGTLNDWLSELPTQAVSAQLLRTQFIRQWGLDLHNLEQDRSTRNLFSYRPTAIHADSPPFPSEVATFARSLWDLAEPVGESRFRLLDHYIVRRVLQRYLANAYGEPTKKSIQKEHRLAVERLLDRVDVPAEMSRDQWVQFLLGETHIVDPNPLIYAANGSLAGQPVSTFDVVSRAFLLLRLATGASYELLASVSHVCSPPEELAFWWHNVGLARGLWAVNSAPESASDLWADMDVALQSLRKAITNNTPPATTHEFQSNWQESIVAMSGAERIGLWGLGL